MYNDMIENSEQLKYVIMVKGKTVSVPFMNEALAQAHIANLPQNQQMIAEVVPVNSEGKRLLLG